MKRIAILLLLALPAQAQEGWVQRGTADLILLDKIRAQPKPISVKVGEDTAFGSMSIHVRSCFSRAPDQPAESTVFVDVTDPKAEKKDLFHGWIFANAPELSQIEDPVYDLRLAACR